MRASWFEVWWDGETVNYTVARSRGRRAASGRFLQQCAKLAGAVERDQVVVAADVQRADIYLRDGAATCFLHHFLTARGLEIDSNLGDLRHAFRAEQPLCLDAEWTNRRRVHHDLRHCCVARQPCTRFRSYAGEALW